MSTYRIEAENVLRYDSETDKYVEKLGRSVCVIEGRRMTIASNRGNLIFVDLYYGVNEVRAAPTYRFFSSTYTVWLYGSFGQYGNMGGAWCIEFTSKEKSFEFALQVEAVRRKP